MLGVVIGRFQPFHNSHKDLVDYALANSEKVLIIVGSSFRSLLPRNPFTFEERRGVIRKIYPNIHIKPCEDYISDEAWAKEITSIIKEYTSKLEEVCIYGDPVDNEYNRNSLNGVAYNYQDYTSELGIRASEVRSIVYNSYHPQSIAWEHLVPPETKEFLNGVDADLIEKLSNVGKRNLFTQGIYVTVDNIVLCRNHIVLIRRKDNGVYALPGGYLEKDERIVNGALRELEEETGLTKDVLSPINKQFVIDNVHRSGFGRLISHVYSWYALSTTYDVPEVRGGDDAKEALWVDYSTLSNLKDQFHDDHYQIISYAFAKRGSFGNCII